MYGNMVDIQSLTAEIRRGKKEQEETTEQKYNVRIQQNFNRPVEPPDLRYTVTPHSDIWQKSAGRRSSASKIRAQTKINHGSKT